MDSLLFSIKHFREEFIEPELKRRDLCGEKINELITKFLIFLNIKEKDFEILINEEVLKYINIDEDKRTIEFHENNLELSYITFVQFKSGQFNFSFTGNIKPFLSYKKEELTLKEFVNMAKYCGFTYITERTIRHYEQMGLLPKPARKGKYKIYKKELFDRIEIISDLKNEGKTLEEIKNILLTNLT
jgi:hypothetical protein